MKGFLPLVLAAAVVSLSAYAIPGSSEGNNSLKNWGVLSSNLQTDKTEDNPPPTEIHSVTDEKPPPYNFTFVLTPNQLLTTVTLFSLMWMTTIIFH